MDTIRSRGSLREVVAGGRLAYLEYRNDEILILDWQHSKPDMGNKKDIRFEVRIHSIDFILLTYQRSTRLASSL